MTRKGRRAALGALAGIVVGADLAASGRIGAVSVTQSDFTPRMNATGDSGLHASYYVDLLMGIVLNIGVIVIADSIWFRKLLVGIKEDSTSWFCDDVGSPLCLQCSEVVYALRIRLIVSTATLSWQSVLYCTSFGQDVCPGGFIGPSNRMAPSNPVGHALRAGTIVCTFDFSNSLLTSHATSSAVTVTLGYSSAAETDTLALWTLSKARSIVLHSDN